MKSRPYVMVFCDIQMPVLSGFPCVSKLRAWEAEDSSGREPQHIAGMSAYVTEQVTAAAQQAGMDMLLSKPVERTRMLDLVRARATPRNEPPSQTPRAALAGCPGSLADADRTAGD